ncbi:leukocyte-associated immunoglobulin-like receptor 1 isoform X1 [Myotis daubentonii]|uniref:leukocyte-associated immunoglobulin-like receptor 1 isoform X1 n=1 Tax=Myotis daubentonii TaxID=98922 RepID=UPI00287319EF|nr:leukocyte-associated immunoglobulin-like receptor 1 isoform X1 [Myotis daubentonii]
MSVDTVTRGYQFGQDRRRAFPSSQKVLQAEQSWGEQVRVPEQGDRPGGTWTLRASSVQLGPWTHVRLAPRSQETHRPVHRMVAIAVSNGDRGPGPGACLGGKGREWAWALLTPQLWERPVDRGRPRSGPWFSEMGMMVPCHRASRHVGDSIHKREHDRHQPMRGMQLVLKRASCAHFGSTFPALPGLSSKYVYILVGTSVAFLLCLLLLVLLLVRRQRQRKHKSLHSKGEEQRPQERLNPAADITEGTPDEAAVCEPPEKNRETQSPSPDAGDAQEVTYAQLDPRALTLRAAQAVSPQPTEPTADSSTYAELPRR